MAWKQPTADATSLPLPKLQDLADKPDFPAVDPLVLSGSTAARGAWVVFVTAGLPLQPDRVGAFKLPADVGLQLADVLPVKVNTKGEYEVDDDP